MQIVDRLQWYIESGDTVHVCSALLCKFGHHECA